MPIRKYIIFLLQIFSPRTRRHVLPVGAGDFFITTFVVVTAVDVVSLAVQCVHQCEVCIAYTMLKSAQLAKHIGKSRQHYRWQDGKMDMLYICYSVIALSSQ